MRYLKNVVTLEYKPEICIGCRMCTAVCPQGVFAMVDGKAQILDRDACMECGACMRNCPVQALSVKAGVGCASAIIRGMLTGSEPDCGCGEGDSCC